jgi:hypothetical protein
MRPVKITSSPLQCYKMYHKQNTKHIDKCKDQIPYDHPKYFMPDTGRIREYGCPEKEYRNDPVTCLVYDDPVVRIDDDINALELFGL